MECFFNAAQRILQLLLDARHKLEPFVAHRIVLEREITDNCFNFTICQYTASSTKLCLQVSTYYCYGPRSVVTMQIRAWFRIRISTGTFFHLIITKHNT
jgi:hypothetical protein